MRFATRCGLLGLMLGVTSPAYAQSTGLSLDQVVRMLSSGVSAPTVAQTAKDACIVFPMDSVAEAALGAIRASRELLASLRTTCFYGAILEVVTDPPGVDVVVDQRSSGKTPYRARTVATSSSRVQVSRGEQSQNFDVEIPRGMRVRVSFEMLDDTLALPPERSARQVAEELGLMRQWVPPVRRPDEPVPPSQPGNGFRSLLVGAVTAGIGFAAASVSPTPCHNKQVVAQDSYVGDQLYRAGAEVDLGLKPACAATVAGGVGLVSALIGTKWLAARSRSQMRQYEAAKKQYPDQIAQWEAATVRERSAWLAANPQVNDILAKQVQDRQARQAMNDTIKRRNAARRLPTVVNTPITATSRP